MNSRPLIPSSNGPLKIAVLCIADADNIEISENAGQLIGRLVEEGNVLSGLDVVPNDDEMIREHVQCWIDTGMIDVIVTLDNSAHSADGLPPGIVVSTTDRGDPTYTRLIYDQAFGFAGLIDLKTTTPLVA